MTPAPPPPAITDNGGICTPWASVGDVTERLNDTTVTEPTIVSATRAASEILFGLSGRRWSGGGCTAIVRPAEGCMHRPWALSVAQGGGYGGNYGSSYPMLGSAGWSPQDITSRCPAPPTVRLGAHPVTSITRVLIDGAVLDPARYRISPDQRGLVRLADADGTNPGWPVCQRWDLPSSEDGTFEVQFVYGSAPPEGGRLACISLAAELAKAMTPGVTGCRLPGRVTNVQSQGVAIVVDPQTVVKDGLTGLSDVDAWIVAVNPDRLSRRATVLSPDFPAGRAPRVPATASVPSGGGLPPDGGPGNTVIDGGTLA